MRRRIGRIDSDVVERKCGPVDGAPVWQDGIPEPERARARRIRTTSDGVSVEAELALSIRTKVELRNVNIVIWSGKRRGLTLLPGIKTARVLPDARGGRGRMGERGLRRSIGWRSDGSD